MRMTLDRAAYPFETLPDYLAPGMRLLLVGINPSVYSVQQGHYFARRINRFWPAFSASRLSADAAVALLRDSFGYPEEKLDAVHHAIHAHSFSAGVPVQSVEAGILQDADRMEALGAIGIARMFYTGGKMGSALFDPDDILAEHRPLDDRRFSLDHIDAKLLKLPATMNTAAPTSPPCTIPGPAWWRSPKAKLAA